MSVSGLCEICERPDVEYTCDRCGRLVCDRHFDREKNLCTDCAADVEEPTDGRQPTGEDLPDGVDTYRF